MAFDFKSRSKGLPLAAGGLLFACSVFAQEWPKVPFAEWPRVPVSQLKAPEPFVDSRPVPGSITPKKFPPPRQISYCNRRGPYGVWDRVPC